MSHSLLTNASFFKLLEHIDSEFAATCHLAGCCLCSSPVDKASFVRKPRGQPPGLGPTFELRHSFCCRQDGCRKRHTPQSVRFCGRRVYLGVVVLIFAAAHQGLSGARDKGIQDALGVDRRTIKRWLSWWKDYFPESDFWRIARARFMPPLDEQTLASSLVKNFGALQDGFSSAVTECLRFLAPGWR